MSVKQIRHCLYCSAVAIYYFTGKLSRKGILPRRDHYASTRNQQYFWTTPWAHYLFLHCRKTRRARVSQFVFVVAIAAVEGMETAQRAHLNWCTLWSCDNSHQRRVWLREWRRKKKVLKWALLWAWVSLCNFIRVYEDQSKQYEDTEHAHSPALSVHKPINFQDMQRPWGKWVCWSDEPPFPGNSPTKTISLSLAMPPALQRAQFLL